MGLMITDERLRLSVERFFEKLEKFFPEHKVFALDSIDKDLREKLSELYKKTGCATAEEFLGAYGFQIISGDEVRKLRSFVLYTPGNEPDVIKGKVENMLRRLREYYPDGKISSSMQKEHKSLSQSVSGLYQWLGYENSHEMLAAYGFNVQHSDGGRPTNDYQQLITFLQKKYSGDNKAKSMGILVHDNPEYAGQIKTLQNRANELFGMSFSKYLKEIGVIGTAPTATVEKKKLFNYFMVAVEGQTAPLPCATDTRTIHEGDFIEMCRVSDQTKLIGQVTQTYYFVPEEDLPCPVEQMRQFVRKVTKAELREREASKEKYIFCSVRLRDRHDSLYYLSPFEDIEAGDLVSVPHSWYGLTDGVVVEVRRASEKTAPYSVKKTKKIERIIKRVREESRKAAEAIDKLAQEHGTKPYTPKQIDHTAQTKFEQCTYFSSAIFRGLEKEIRAALRIIHPAAFDVMTYHKQLLEGVGQFECPSPFVPIILENYPNLKGVFFAESWKEKSVYLAYSDSGCSTVSTMRPIGECDFYTRDRWTLAHDPTEESFTFQGGRYVFEEKSQWEKCDFVLDDTKTQLAGQIVIPSDPHRKRLTTEPCQIIKICYPDEETFYTPAPQETKPKVDKPVSENVANLSGKAFVVTGDLYHYDSREDLKAIIEQAGGKMTGSVSSKTTALITNFPDSGTTKIRKAKECGIEIISEDEFIRRYMSGSSTASIDDQAAVLADAERKHKEAEELKLREEEERKRKEAEELKLREEEERKRKEAEELKLREEEERKRKEAEEQKRREEEERKRKEEERQAKLAVARKRLEEAQRIRREAEEQKHREEEERKRKEAETLKLREEEEHKRKEGEERRRREEASRRSPEEKFVVEMEAWNTNASPILQQREEARQLLILQSRTKKLAEIEQKRNAQIAEETQKKETLTAERISSEQKLATLGFLQFLEKSRTKSRIEQLTTDINACDERMRTAEETYRKDLGQLDKRVATEVKKHELELKMKYPLPRKPRKTIPKMSPAQLADAALKMAILDTVASHGILSFKEIMDKCYALAGLNVPKVRPLVESLVREGELIETTKQKNHEIHHYFEIAY